MGTVIPKFAAKRLALIEDLPRLDPIPEADALAERLLRSDIIPQNAAEDALHLALAAVHAMDFLLTWNCTHIHNVNVVRRIERLCAQSGYTCPLICSPDELLSSSSL